MGRIAAADVYDIAIPFSPRIAPNGDRIAFVRRIPRDEQEHELTVYLVRTDGSAAARRFSLVDGMDAMPRWGPAGDRLAFTSTRGAEDDRRQLWVVPVDGGEGGQITNVVGHISAFDWSPDGSYIAFVQSVSADDRDTDRDLEVAPDHEASEPDPRVIDRTVYRSQGEYFDGRQGHVYVVDLAATTEGPTASAIERITSEPTEATVPRWGDDRALYYLDEWVGDDPDDIQAYDVVRCDLDDGAANRIHRTSGQARALDVGTGGRVAIVHTPDDRATLQQEEVHVVEADSDCVVEVTAALDRTLSSRVVPQWGPSGEYVYFATPDEGADALWRAPGDGTREPERLARAGEVAGAHVGGEPDSPRVALALSQWDHPGDVFLATEEDLVRLTRLNDTYLEERTVAEPEPITFESDGEAVDGWVLGPSDAEPGATYPLVVEVHGGPHVMWTEAGTTWHEFQTLAARGYVVCWTNPRGSAGYGDAFMRAIDRDWGATTLQDVLAAVDHVSDRPEVDENAVFLTGGSFGGFLTAWAVGSTDRFEAAVAQRGVYDLTGFYGTTDGAYKLVEGDFGTRPWAEPGFLWTQSPASRGHRVTTPTLVLHSDEDHRTPPGTAELFYRMLRKLDVETRLVRYPREGHELSRSGEPAHMVDRIERIARWFDGYSPHHDVPPATERPDDADLTTDTGAETQEQGT